MDPAAKDYSTPKLDLDLTILPPVFLLPTHLSLNELHGIEEQLIGGGAPLTYDIAEAKLVLGAIWTERRATFELKSRKVFTEVVSKEIAGDTVGLPGVDSEGTPPRKKRRLGGNVASSPATTAVRESSTELETNDETETETEAATSPAGPMSQLSISQASTTAAALSSDPAEPVEETPPPFAPESFSDVIKVVKLEWLNSSLAAGRLQPLEPYVVYEGRVISRPEDAVTPQEIVKKTIFVKANTSTEGKASFPQQNTFQGDFKGAKPAFAAGATKYKKRNHVDEAMHKEFQGRSFASSSTQASQRASQRASQNSGQFKTRPTHLLHQTTSEHDEGVSSSLPEMPDWVKEGKIYACERAAPFNSPNEDFMELLKKIRLARTLTADEIGVRAYSTSIASIAAYPHKLSSTREILMLPGCDQKIAHLFHEYSTTGRIQAVEDLEADPTLRVLRLFYEIWGVGATTARQFFYDHNYRDLDDIVERGWHSLSRVQQIGLKYYDEFQLKIPRAEVESIAATIHTHARRVRGEGIECIIVGGYRRGKLFSGDVDLILSHRNESATLNLVADVVTSLETEGWITHTLTLALTNSHRNQQPLPLRVTDASARGAGFDTLDKALVVWQDIHWPSREADLALDPKAKNPNPHRRVDIIIAPWKTVGCGVAGWTSGTTFQRDLRRYAKKVKGWKFDSSGVRERGSGRWVDLERGAGSWEEAERRVFAGLGLVWREPGERCTG
ncbi:terminal deoxynucleotidyl [Lasallia pustulata]|uniref:DNA-directed DNA polymerase n=1 Tax=Lasallia pustulata TaxID=136370 RepID=A0A1W5D9T8_9LECA|nr:terminal deoxynucleotidyl [Lasallia pustulata]